MPDRHGAWRGPRDRFACAGVAWRSRGGRTACVLRAVARRGASGGARVSLCRWCDAGCVCGVRRKPAGHGGRARAVRFGRGAGETRGRSPASRFGRTACRAYAALRHGRRDAGSVVGVALRGYGVPCVRGSSAQAPRTGGTWVPGVARASGCGPPRRARVPMPHRPGDVRHGPGPHRKRRTPRTGPLSPGGRACRTAARRVGRRTGRTWCSPRPEEGHCSFRGGCRILEVWSSSGTSRSSGRGGRKG